MPKSAWPWKWQWNTIICWQESQPADLGTNTAQWLPCNGFCWKWQWKQLSCQWESRCTDLATITATSMPLNLLEVAVCGSEKDSLVDESLGMQTWQPLRLLPVKATRWLTYIVFCWKWQQNQIVCWQKSQSADLVTNMATSMQLTLLQMAVKWILPCHLFCWK